MPKHSGLIMHDPHTGMHKAFHRLHDGGWAYETVQDIEPIIEANKVAQNHIDQRMMQGAVKRVASIPLVMIQKLWNEHGIDYWNPAHQEAVDRWLDDPENKWMRTDDSVLSRRRVSKAQIERRLAERKLWASL